MGGLALIQNVATGRAWRNVALVASLWSAAAVAGAQVPNAQAQQGKLPALVAQTPVMELPGSVSPVVSRAAVLGHLNPQQPLRVDIGLKFGRPAEAQAYADAVSDPTSPLYHHFLTPIQIEQNFGPVEADYQAVITYLQARGLHVQNMTPTNRRALRVEGTAAQMEAAFGTRLNLYQEGLADRIRRVGPNGQALTFYANATPVQLPAIIAPQILGIIGLNNYARPRPAFHHAARSAVAPYTPNVARTAYDLAPLYNASSPLYGTGRSVAIVALGYINTSDIVDYINAFSLPTPPSMTSVSTAANNVTFVNVAGGAPVSSPNDVETDLDSQMVLGMAPLVNLYIYNSDGNSSFPLQNYYDIIVQIASDNKADIVTDSNTWDLAGQTSNINIIHDEFLQLTMQGITYLSASGDAGSNLMYFYPEAETEVLDVGGTVMTVNNNNNIASETGWSQSGGGYTSQAPFARPSYQTGRGVPTTINFRMIPDIALHSAGANNAGAYVFYQAGTLQTQYVGTSFAAPLCAGSLAVVEEYLINNNALPLINGHYRLGRLNDTLYAFNGRNDVFHDITSGHNAASSTFPSGFSCTSFWDLVTGWGSLDFNNLALALATPLSVSVTPTGVQVPAGTGRIMSATVHGSGVPTVNWAVVGGSSNGTISATGVYTAPPPDSVTTPQSVQVQATSTVNTSPAVSGTATLTIVPTALQGLGLNAASVAGGTTVQATLTLNGPAGSKGVQATLKSNSSAAAVPSSATVATGQASQTFNVKTTWVLSNTPVVITATYNGVSVTANLTVKASALAGNPAPVGPSQPAPPLHNPAQPR
jgi:subtilase family serine protease